VSTSCAIDGLSFCAGWSEDDGVCCVGFNFPEWHSKTTALLKQPLTASEAVLLLRHDSAMIA